MRQGVKRIVRQHLPDWPNFVIEDWLAPSLCINKINSQEQLTALKAELTRLNMTVGDWQFYSKMPISMDKFNPYTRYRIKVVRDYGNKIQEKVPDDIHRVKIAKSRILASGIESCPPIILINMPDGYELIEGWHRVMAAFSLIQQNDNPIIKINTWIGKPSDLFAQVTTEQDSNSDFYTDVRQSIRVRQHLDNVYEEKRKKLMSETGKQKAEWVKAKLPRKI